MSSLVSKEFNERLREWRRRRALSQRELAGLAGVQPVTVARLETGSQQPRPRTIRRLAKALDITVDELQGPI
ncbi:MAG: helix-turn-helix transcriptional regulator [Chloroflexi bacterium]|nr:helix-turn-helix transcriptional regulator [Chloroflexota bacterium]